MEKPTGMATPLCVTVLAAGKGTRMRNALPKVSILWWAGP